MTGNAAGTYSYGVNCTGNDGVATASTDVTYVAPPVSISFTANPAAIYQWSSTNLVWSSTNADRCSASGAWNQSSLLTNGAFEQRLNDIGTYTFTITCTGGGASASASQTVTVTRDPTLMSGFPVQAYMTAGMYQAGPASMVVALGNLDASPDLEIVASATASGPLYAVKADGTPLAGWPEQAWIGVGYPSIGTLVATGPSNVVSGHGPYYQSCNADRYAYGADGQVLPGWPITSCNAGTTQPPMLADLNGDGIDEVFFGFDAYNAAGQRLSGWPGGQSYGIAMASGDINNDGLPEVVTVGSGSIDALTYAGMHVAGFPFAITQLGYNSKSVELADIDGDGVLDIVQVGRLAQNPGGYGYVRVYNVKGQLLWTAYTTGDVYYDSLPSLADLDGDGRPEIIMQSFGAIDAWRYDGTEIAGFPVTWGAIPYQSTANDGDQGSSSPVVGDIDGDGSPDVLVLCRRNDGEGIAGRVRAYSHSGQLLQGFPKDLPIGDAMVPAIGDLQHNGHNDIVVGGTQWDGTTGNKDFLWAFDLGGSNYGPIMWGQMGGDAKHRNVYPVPVDAPCDSISGGASSLTTSVDAGCANCTISNPQRAADGNLDTYATVSVNQAAPNAGAAIRATAPTGTTYSAGRTAGAYVSVPAGGGQSYSVTVRTLLNGTIQEVSNADKSSGTCTSCTGHNSSFDGFRTTKQFNAVEVLINNNQVSGTSDFHVYEICSNHR